MFLSQPRHILLILCVCGGAAKLQKKVNSYSAKTNQGIHPPGFKDPLSGFDHNPHCSLISEAKLGLEKGTQLMN
jgi:hypothetical protein